ncbi:MAG: hypothetical protein JRJ19_07215 [Deltaproteobacteria bacterium]|nr:hypothetical protein [Deltaproteobacteria bacterium]MBW1871836.1 hypothetical protein [Deltaproteobacteria bacterium]
MLREVSHINQKADKPFQRWFTDDYFDLFVWFDDADEIIQFQLAYKKNTADEKTLIWKAESGYDHFGIDDGENAGRIKAAPILVADGIFDCRKVADRFSERSGSIDQGVATFVEQKLLAYSDLKGDSPE